MPLRSDVATKARLALIIACSDYRDATLQQLRAPARDAEAFADVLRDAAIGDFEVRILLNLPSADLLRGIGEFCADSRPQDLLLIYLSCHGVLDDRGRLYYATVNTERRLLAATSVSAQWLNDQLEDSPPRQQLLILDCCHSGAFAKGMKGTASLALQDRFSGRGRVVLSASRATEYSFEGNQVLGEGAASVFTAAIVEGLRTGDADRDNDGLITATDLYEHVYERISAAESRQTPALWSYGAEGNILVARSPRGAIVAPVALPEDLRATLDSPRPRVRESAVAELADLLDRAEPGLVLTAQRTLAHIAEEDIARVAGLARVALGAGHGQAAEQVRIEVEQRAQRQAEERAAQQAAERAEREAAEQAEREAAEQAKREAAEQAKREAAEQAEREAAEQAEREAAEQAEREAAEQAKRDAEVPIQAITQATEQARRDTEKQAQREADEHAQRDAGEAKERDLSDAPEEILPETRRWRRLITRRSAAIALFSVSLAIGIAVVLTYPRSTDSGLSQLPTDLRGHCRAVGGSFYCNLEDNTVVIYNVFPTAEAAKADVVGQDNISGSCPSPTPTPTAPSTTPLVCEYAYGTQRGVSKFSYVTNSSAPFYQARWNPYGKKVTGTLSTSAQTSTQDWAALWEKWTRIAAMG